jgi:hypothetical protein
MRFHGAGLPLLPERLGQETPQGVRTSSEPRSRRSREKRRDQNE